MSGIGNGVLCEGLGFAAVGTLGGLVAFSIDLIVVILKADRVALAL